MLITCWSVKGGVGTSVVAASLALVLAGRDPAGALLVDLAGDQPAVLGLPLPEGPTVLDWLGARGDVGDDGLRRLEVAAAPGLDLLWSDGSWPDVDPTPLVTHLALERRAVVVDAGRIAHGGHAGAAALVGAAAISLLVLRPCYVALRRALACEVAPTGVVLVSEPGRALGRTDVERVLDVPVVAQVEVEPAIARTIDAGLLANRMPRSLARAHARCGMTTATRTGLDDDRRRVDAAAVAAHRAVLAERAAAVGAHVAPSTPDRLRDLVRRADPLLADRLVDLAVAQVGALAAGLGRLDPLLADDAVSEIMVNGDGRVWVERRRSAAPDR